MITGKRILAVDSSAVSASCAVTEGSRLISQSFVNVGLTHSETLLTLISGTLDSSGITLSDVDYIAVTNGPGSFTGIRIGVSTVKGLAFTTQKPCVGVSTPEAICCGMYGECGTGDPEQADAICCPVMDARRDQVYNALFSVSAGAEACYPRRLCPDRAISIEELCRELRESYSGKTVRLCGDGAGLVYSKLSTSLPDVILAPAQLRYQTGYGTAIAALRAIEEGKAVSPDKLVPVYLRPSQAERELAEKLAAEQ